MKKISLPLLFFMVLNVSLHAQPLTLQEKLGYSKNTKLLIIHADDLGMSHSENAASIHAMEKGSVNSASIMVPCPWFPEIAAYSRTHPKADLGLHLTLTSEWNLYKWDPVTDKSEVPGLINKYGFLFQSVDSLVQSAKTAEVEKEIRAQIERAKLFGIDVTHLDSHMGSVFGKPEFLEVYLKLGREYRLPVLLSKEFSTIPGFDKLLNGKDVLLDRIITANPADFKIGMENYYTNVLKSVQPGVSIILLHAAYDNEEKRAATIDHPDWGAAWRQADFNFFTSEKCKKLLKEQDIRLITWREIRDKLLR
jgi:predicted glycoside hydrolase/deacetylase ChbG (UPF0249 family)